MGKKIVFCRCRGERIPSERLELIEDNLRNVNSEVCVLSDLCLLAASGREKLAEVFSEENDYLIIGCYERSMKLLLDQLSAESSNLSAEYINIIETSDDDILQRISGFSNDLSNRKSITEVSVKTDWISWYPVIDYSRCTACGQCADFCLFGVYEKSTDLVKVVNPQECKYNCPACARICPQTAIIFPKYKYGGAIGGSEHIDEVEEQKRQSTDIKNILEGDIYSALERRKSKRQSIIRDEAMKRAIEERDKALGKN
jgi:NAD-dependent dihydropyrimidine dehydrogenase PreA subunit